MAETLLEEVHAPNGGLVDTVQLDLLRGSDAQVMANMHHDRLALERRQGFTVVGSPTPDLFCYGGFHYRQANGNSFIVRVQGGNTTSAPPLAALPTMLYAGTGSSWVGAQSGAVAATAVDQIGNGQIYGFGTFVQYADWLYWYDGGTFHKRYNGAVIQDYGLFAGATIPAGTLAAGGGDGSGVGYSFTFDGSTYLSVGVTGINGATDFTFACWVKTSSSAADGLMWAWGNTTNYAGTSINGAGSNRELLEMQRNGSYTYAASPAVIADGNWHHVAGIRAGNQGQIWIDGGIVDTSTFPSNALTATVMYLGAIRANTAVQNMVTGSMDDCRFYNKALSALEMLDLFNGGNTASANLRGHWKLDEGSGTTIVDSSGYGNNGTITGTATWAQDGPSQLVGGGNNGSLQAGDYRFVYTYYNPITAEESPPSEASNTVTLGTANGVLDATVPANSAWTLASGFTVIRFYRTTANGAAYLFDHEITISALPVTEELSKADENLGAEVDFGRGALPRLRYCILYNEMIVGAGDPTNPSTLYWSFVGDPTHWPPENAQDIDKDNGDPITGIFRLFGRLYVLKQTSGIYMLTPQFDNTGAVSFSVEAVTNDFGCLSHHSIVVIDTYAYWADAKGIVRFNGQQCENISDPKIRYRWRELASNVGIYAFQTNDVLLAQAQGIAGPPAMQCYAVHDRQADHNYYRLSIDDWTRPAESAPAIDLVYDLSIGCWFEDRYSYLTAGRSNQVAWLVKMRTGQYQVYKGDRTGRAYRLRYDVGGNYVYNDGNSNLPTVSQWRSKWWGGLDGVIPKWLEIEYERSEVGYATGPVTINLYQDGMTTPTATDTTSLTPYASNSPASTDSTIPDPQRLTHTARIDWNAEWCRRFCFEVLCSANNTQLRILQFRVGYVPCGQALKAK